MALRTTALGSAAILVAATSWAGLQPGHASHLGAVRSADLTTAAAPGPAPAAPVVTDPFTNGSGPLGGTSTGTGQTWDQHDGTFTVAADGTVTATGGGTAYATVDTGHSEVTVTANLNFHQARNAGLALTANHDGSTHIAVLHNHTAGGTITVEVVQNRQRNRVAGRTKVGTTSTGELTVTIHDGTYHVRLNGHPQLTWTAPAELWAQLSAHTRHGIVTLSDRRSAFTDLTVTPAPAPAPAP